MHYFDDKMGARNGRSAIRKIIEPWLIFDDPSLLASVVLVAVQAPQKPKLKICEQAPAFNFRLLHLRCATAAPLGLIAVLARLWRPFTATPRQSSNKFDSALGLIAVLYLHYFDDKMVQTVSGVQSQTIKWVQTMSGILVELVFIPNLPNLLS